jgi:aminoglycoside/choline kinase family phosphotransferase
MSSKCNEKVQPMESADERKIALYDWLSTTGGLTQITMAPLAGDASFRRYFRIKQGDQSFIAMDAPPPRENCTPFVTIAQKLAQHGLKTPTIYAADLMQGFLLLEDFGDVTLLQAFQNGHSSDLYEPTLDALFLLQRCHDIQLPIFAAAWMNQEWSWHQEWFLNKLLHLPSLPKAVDDNYAQLVASALQQPQVSMHRDYHSANLMLIEKAHNTDEIGILDFQDAFKGPLTYDLASLLRDCYIDWPAEKVEALALSYLHRFQQVGQLQSISVQEFLRWFDWMGLQRHLKALLTFARKKVRDQDAHYLPFIPRTLHYIIQVSAKYPELNTLHDYYANIVQPAFHQEIITCVP